MAWTHRVVRRTYPDGSILLGIVEAFMDDSGRIWGITKDFQAPLVEESAEENIEDLKKVLCWMLEACDKPVIDAKNIPEEGADCPFKEEELEDCVRMDIDQDSQEH